MIPQGGVVKRQHLLQHKEATTAAVAVCSIRLRTSAAYRYQKSKRVKKKDSSMGIQMIKGGKEQLFSENKPQSFSEPH